MSIDRARVWRNIVVAWAIVVLLAGFVAGPPGAFAAGTIKADDDKWISVGMGLRTSFNALENAAGPLNGVGTNHTAYSNEFTVDNLRIYINGKVHKNIGFEVNTECFNCGIFNNYQSTRPSSQFGGNSSIGLLDAIAKFEFDEKYNLWVGRMLLPSERGELNGPFYHATYNGFRTPFFPADFSGNFNAGAGLYGRDNAATFWGKVHPFGTHLLYVISVSQGLRGPANTGNSLMYTGRLQWNLLNDETSPGYYTAGTYYGTAGDIFAIGVSGQHQKDGAGNAQAPFGVSDFTGMSVDLLVEKLIPNNMGVFTFNGEFKRHWARYSAAAFDTTAFPNNGFGCFCTFSGHSWTVYGLYLIPTKVGIGRFQPYGRYTSINPLESAARNEWEGGVNYVIDGHNLRVSAFYTYGDIRTKGLNYSPTAKGDKIDTFHVALQVQY